MHQASSVRASPLNGGPLRRNQACHQCRARKLKCDAGRPCSTCKRSHAKAIASLTSAGQAVLADPCCTYDYAPGEDPWTATLRSGLRLSRSRSRSRSQSGSASPGGSIKGTQMTPDGMGTSTPLPSSTSQVGPVRHRHSTSSRTHSPSYSPSGKSTILTPDPAYTGPRPSPGTSTSPGAYDAFLSPLPPLNDARRLPGVVEPSGQHGMPQYVSPDPFNTLYQDFEYEEMAEMLYNPMGPLMDSPPLFSPLPPYANPLLNGVSSSNEAPRYAYGTSQTDEGFDEHDLERGNKALRNVVVEDNTNDLSDRFEGGISLTKPRGKLTDSNSIASSSSRPEAEAGAKPEAGKDAQITWHACTGQKIPSAFPLDRDNFTREANAPGTHLSFSTLMEERDPAPAPNTIVNSLMTPTEIARILNDHGCTDLTQQLDIDSTSSYAVTNGGFGDVYSGRLTNGTRVAIKAFRPHLIHDHGHCGKHLKRAAKELHTWSKCQHPNVLSLLGLVEFRGQIGMVSPWMDNGSLPSYLRMQPNANRRQLCYAISDGLAYLHHSGIIHGDLKGLNVLISNDGTPLLADFGNSVLSNQSLQFTNSIAKSAVSARWTAPEVLMDLVTSSYPADLFSLGMTLLETITGNVPYFEIERDHAVYMAIAVYKKIPARPEEHIPANECNDMLWSLLTQCWAFEPGSRPTAERVRDKMLEIINVQSTRSLTTTAELNK